MTPRVWLDGARTTSREAQKETRQEGGLLLVIQSVLLDHMNDIVAADEYNRHADKQDRNKKSRHRFLLKFCGR
jgi:hypothetical protein